MREKIKLVERTMATQKLFTVDGKYLQSKSHKQWKNQRNRMKKAEMVIQSPTKYVQKCFLNKVIMELWFD